MDPMLVGAISLLILFFLLMVCKVPIGYGMVLIGFLGFWYLVSFPASMNKLAVIPFNCVANYTMIVMPLFIVMGNIISVTGFGQGLYDAASKWLGRLPGGLAVATIGGCCVIAAVDSGSIAGMSIMGNMAYPEMKRHKYASSLAAGCIAAGSGLGVLIPPSGMMIIYALLTGQPLGKLFMAGVFPGLLLAGIFILIIIIMCTLKPQMGPRGPVTSWKDKIVSLKGCIDVVILILLVLGGILIGWFTPTEAGAIGAAGSIILALIRKKLTWAKLQETFTNTFKITGMVYFIIIGGLCLTSFMAVTELPFRLSELVLGLSIPPWGVMLIILAIYIFLGCIMDVAAMVTLTVPIFYPVVTSLGFSPIWFGVFLVMVVEMAAVTPPVGINVFALYAFLKREVPMGTIFRGIWPFFGGQLLTALILIVFPGIALFLPGLMN
jgi:C4-dicarboxylate transporter, DctM subunit